MPRKNSKNLAKVQDMLDGNFQTKIQVGVGDNEPDPIRKVGDKWVDSDGVPWEQKNGYKVKGRLGVSGQSHHSWDMKCSECESLILKAWDKDTYKADGRCYHCQLNYELDLQFDKPIKWWAYRRLKDFKNMKDIQKEMEQWVDEKEKLNNEKIFDKSVANALANANIDTNNVKLKQQTS